MYCGSDAALWICKHVLTSKHECVYAICSTCKYEIEDKDKKKTQNVESEMMLILQS